MPCNILVGAQWGDEGKAKIIDYLCNDAKYIVRYQGGANAGHTVLVGKEKFVFHLVPSGILHPDKMCLIGAGLVVDPFALLEEIDSIEKRGISTKGRIKISGNTHVILPYHKIMDICMEQELGSEKIGTTGRGIGPAYLQKAERTGIRINDIILGGFEEKIRTQVKKLNFMLENYYITKPFEIFKQYYTGNTVDADKIIDECNSIKDKLKELADDVYLIVKNAIINKEKVLCEGAQGTGLDVDFGTYPFVTSSNPIAGGACTGIGIGPTKIENVYGIFKSYITRVGSGPFPTELDNEEGETLRKIGNEFGATTGRPRRCGWFDGVFGKYACWINGLTHLVITKLDVLDTFEEIKFCTGYEIDREIHKDFTTHISSLKKVKPVYKTFPGWQENTSKISTFSELPENAKKYLNFMEDYLETPIYIVSTGPERDATIIKD